MKRSTILSADSVSIGKRAKAQARWKRRASFALARAFAIFSAPVLIIGTSTSLFAQPAPVSRGTLLQFDFNDAEAWAQKTTPGAGTIDLEGTKDGSGALVHAVDASAEGSNAVRSGPLAVKNAEKNLGKLTLSFSLSASVARPVTVRIESLNADKKPTGALETLIFPAAPDFYQRYALDLSTLKAAGAGKFNPADPFVSLTFDVKGIAGWEDAPRRELRLDNVNYAVPAYYVSPAGKDTNDGRTEATAFATPQAALDAAGPGDIILLMDGTYNGGLKPTASFVRAGTPAAWIVLKNYPGQKPTITGNGWNIVSLKFGSKETLDTEHTLANIEIRGLHVRGEADLIPTKFPDTVGKQDQRSNSNGISLDARYMAHVPNHIRIADNLIEYCPGLGIGSIEGDWITLENNISRNNSWLTVYATSGISVMGCSNFDATDNVYKDLIRNNICNRNETYQQWGEVKRISDGNGIILDVNQGTVTHPKASYLGRTLVTNNLSFDNGGGGIHCVRANRVDIINNTTYLNSASKALQYSQIDTYGSKDVRIMNNILVAPVADVTAGEKPEPVNRLGGKNTDVVFTNNLYFGGNIAPKLGEGDRVGDPLFVHASRDPAVADFHLEPGSPAIGAGLQNDVSPILDFDGKYRPLKGPSDLGAFQK